MTSRDHIAITSLSDDNSDNQDGKYKRKKRIPIIEVRDDEDDESEEKEKNFGSSDDVMFVRPDNKRKGTTSKCIDST
jgi:hypothetical protein